jgi:ribose transport system permease protein
MMQQVGLLAVILLLSLVLVRFSGTHVDRETGQTVSNFFNPGSLVQILTETSFFAIMAVGMTLVIVSGGIDLSIGSVYALAGVGMALTMRAAGWDSPWAALALCIGFGLLAGVLNGTMVATLGVHPFIVTLGTMWVFRGVAFVVSKAESVLVPGPMTDFAKNPLFLGKGLTPVPAIVMGLFILGGALYLNRTTMGRRVLAVGGNADAARYAGLPIPYILAGVYVIAGLGAGIAAFLGAAYFGSASSADANGYELYVIASAVVGGVSLNGGRGTVTGAFLGALLIVLIRTGIRLLRLDQNYEWIIIGAAIIIAVVLDRLGARLLEKRMVNG